MKQIPIKATLWLLAMFVFISTKAQNQKTVSGKVVDEKNAPISGALISIKDGHALGATDESGHFTFKVPVSVDSITIKSVGYTPQNYAAVPDLSTLVLTSTSAYVGEVVVTALGIKKEARALGYSVTKVGSDRIMAAGTPTNPLQALYGSASGVQVAATAAGASGAMKINIRNAISFDQNSTTRPLFVVDGVPIHDQATGMGADATNRDNGTGINDINPDDIASFEILKGAKASVLYGSEGANGVVLITTKSGTGINKGLGVSASLTTTWDKAAFFPKLQTEYGSGESASSPNYDAQGFYINGNGVRALDPMATQAFGPKFDPSVSVLYWDGVARPWVPQTSNIYNDLYRTGHQTSTNIAMQGSNDKGSIRFSYTNMAISPIQIGGSNARNTFSLNSSYKLNDHISLRYTGNFYFDKNINAPNLGTMGSGGFQSELGAYSADINVGLIQKYLVTPDGYDYFAPQSKSKLFATGTKTVASYLWNQEQNQDIFTRLHNVQSLQADIKIDKVFSATLMGGMDYASQRDVYKGKLLDPSLLGPQGGQLYQDVTTNYTNTYGQAMLNFNTRASDFDVSGFVGGAIRNQSMDSKGARALGNLVIPNWFSFNNLPLGVQPNYIFSNGEDMLYSLMASAQVAWKRQVYVEAQGRKDWSSILPENHNSYFYPGLSATWIMTQSLKLPAIVNFAKLRASWADVGRPGPRYFSNVNYTVSQSGGGYVLTPPTTLPPIDANGNPNLKPERKREFEVGFEGYLFNNQRLGIDFSYYTANTYDQIMAVAAPPGTGVSSVIMNAGSVLNHGWELAIKTKPVFTNDFKWNLDFTFSAAKTKVNKLDGKLTSLTLWTGQGINTVAQVGQEYGQIYQVKSEYTYTDPSNANNPLNGQKVVASSGTNYDYSTNTPVVVGKMLPDVIGGVSTAFQYKNLRLIANLDYSFGATNIAETEAYMMAAGVLKESLKYRDAAHGGVDYYMNGTAKVAGTNPNAGGITYHDGVILDGVVVNNGVATKNTNVVSASDYYYNSYFANGFFPKDRIFKSDYLALRNIAIDYTVPAKLFRKVKLNNLVVSVFANNVAYLYKAAPNSIPEATNGAGWGQSNYGSTALPAQRSIGVAVKVNF